MQVAYFGLFCWIQGWNPGPHTSETLPLCSTPSLQLCSLATVFKRTKLKCYFFLSIFIHIYYFTFSDVFRAVIWLIISRAVTQGSASLRRAANHWLDGASGHLPISGAQGRPLYSCHYHQEMRACEFLRRGVYSRRKEINET